MWWDTLWKFRSWLWFWKTSNQEKLTHQEQISHQDLDHTIWEAWTAVDDLKEQTKIYTLTVLNDTQKFLLGMIERQSYEDDFPILFDRLRERHFADNPEIIRWIDEWEVLQLNAEYWDLATNSARLDKDLTCINDIFLHPKLQFAARMSGYFEEGFVLGVDDARTLADACVAYLSKHFQDLTPEQQYVVRNLHKTWR